MDKNQNHKKKMIAPVIITVCLIAYYVLYFALILAVTESRWAVLLGIVPAVLGAVSIYVCVQRIAEIRSGEEDDLGKY